MERALVVFWFGRELVIAAGEELQTLELPERGDEIGVIVHAIESVEPTPRDVRLIYHPSDLEMHAVECAKGGRNVVQETLGESHPVLRRAETIWAASRLQPTETGFATLLWIELKPRLQRLRLALASRRIRLTGAWPVASLFEQTPPVDQPGEAALAVLLTDGGGVVYAVTPGGLRTMVWSLGREHRVQVGGLLRNALSHFAADDPPPVLVVDGSSEPWDLGVGPLAGLNPVTLGLDALLAGAQLLRPSDLANFIPHQTVLKLDAALRVCALACAAAAVVCGGLYLVEYRRLQGDASARRVIADTLRVEADRLRANERSLTTLRSFREETDVAGRGRLALLFAVMEHKPVELTVHAITISGRTFEIKGTAHEGVGQTTGPYQRFVSALAAKTNPWQLAPATMSTTLATSSFIIGGSFP